MAALRQRVLKAVANKKLGNALADHIEALNALSKIGTTTNVRTDTLGNLGADTEARLDAIEAKVDALIAAGLKLVAAV